MTTNPDPGNQAFLLAADRAWETQCEEEDEAIDLDIECQVYLEVDGARVFADPVTIVAHVEAWPNGYYRALTVTTDADYVIDLLGKPSKLDPIKRYLKHHIHHTEEDRIKGLIEAKFADLGLNA